MNLNNIDETKGIVATMVLEVMGKPPEHLTETLESLIKQLDEEKHAKVRDKKIHEIKELEKQKGFFTTFAEVEIEVEDILNLAILMFKYMPAHIEIISPEAIVLTNSGWSDILSEVTRRLHGYDEIARVVQVEKAVLEKKLREALGDKGDKEKK